MASGEKILQYFKSNACFKGLECNLFFIDEKLDFNEFNVPFVCIINTKSKYGYVEGKESHWVCLYYNGNREKCIIFFDSLAKPPPSQVLKNIYNSGLFNCVSYSNLPIQSRFTELCGLYVVMLVYLVFCKGLSFAQFLDTFSSNTAENDKHMFSIYNKDLRKS